MTEAMNWRDVKAKARAADPTRDSAERVARRQPMRKQMLASISGAQLAEIRQHLGLTQVQLAEATGLTQARISQIDAEAGHLLLHPAQIGNRGAVPDHQCHDREDGLNDQGFEHPLRSAALVRREQVDSAGPVVQSAQRQPHGDA